MASGEPERRRVPIARVVIVLGVIVLSAMLVRRLDTDKLLAALRRASFRLVAAAALLNVTLNTVARVRRWSALLAALPSSDGGAGFLELATLYFASQATSNLLPARAGEALRVVQLHRRHGYAVSGLITVQLVETIVGAMTLGLLALLIAPLAQTPASLSVPLYTFAACGLGGGVLLFFLARGRRGPLPVVVKPDGDDVGDAVVTATTPLHGVAKVVSFLRRTLLGLVEAVRSLRSPRVWAGSLAWSLVSDLTDVAMVGLVLGAVGVSLSPLGWIVAFVAINLVLLLPTTPAQLGVLEMGAVAALRALGVDGSAALAFALLYHAAHVLPPTLVGGIVLLRLDLQRRAGGAGAA